MKLFSAVIALVVSMAVETSAQPQVLNGILVRVNDSVVTWKDVQNRMAADLPYLAQQYRSQPEVLEKKRSELQQSILNQLVEERLILHEFKTAGYKFPESFLEDLINQQIRNQYGDRVTLTKTLQAEGLTFESYRTRLREREIIRLMRQQNVPRDPVISPHRIEVYYVENRDQFKVDDQIKLRMIVIPSQAVGSSATCRKLAEELLAKIKEGAPFEEMARIYSHGSQSSEGGDWGWVDKKVLRADLAEKAFGLEAGQHSGVIEAQDGCYIMLVEERRAAHTKSLSEVRDEIETTLKEQENRRLHQKWIDRLKNKSFVRYY